MQPTAHQSKILTALASLHDAKIIGHVAWMGVEYGPLGGWHRNDVWERMCGNACGATNWSGGDVS